MEVRTLLALDFPALWDYRDVFVQGIRTTAVISVLSIVVSLPVGLYLAIQRNHRYALVRWPVAIYTQVFRNLPLIVVIYIFFYGLPGAGIQLNAFLCGWLSLSLNGSAHLTEVFRGGLAAIPRGQFQAGLALGLSRRQVITRVVVPQLLRVVYPSLGNQVVYLVLGSSLVTVVGINELTHASYTVGAASFRYVEAFIVAACGYFLLVQLINWVWRWIGRTQIKGMAIPHV